MINLAAWLSLGGMLGVAGIQYYDWKYWMFTAIVVVISITSWMRGRAPIR